MGAAAYNRGSAAISRQIDQDMRAVEFEVMHMLNHRQKHPDAVKPFGPIQFVFDKVHDCWWAECPVTGFGYAHPKANLHEVVRRYQVEIVAYDRGVWKAEPCRA